MVDTISLNKLIREKRITKTELAKRLGLSRYGLYKKLNNETEFKPSEITPLCDMLGIRSLRDREAIFFKTKVEK